MCQGFSFSSFNAIRIYGLSYVLIGVNVLASAYLTALEQPKYSLVTSMSYTFVFVLIGLMVFPQLLGPSGLWWGCSLEGIFDTHVATISFGDQEKNAKRNYLIRLTFLKKTKLVQGTTLKN